MLICAISSSAAHYAFCKESLELQNLTPHVIAEILIISMHDARCGGARPAASISPLHDEVWVGRGVFGGVKRGGRIVAASEMLRPSVGHIQQAEGMPRGFKK